VLWCPTYETLPSAGIRPEMRKRLLLLLAHPDDETFGPGGTIAKYAREGADVHLVTATRGEMGMAGDPPLADREHLGEVREGELRAAAGILGIREVVFLGFLDRELSSLPRERIVAKAVEQVRRIRPHVVIGFGPEGVSRHPDHVIMSAVALEAFEAAADPARFPIPAGEGSGPWAAHKLYRFEIAQEILAAWDAPLAGVPRDTLTTFIDTSAYVDAKLAALRCHRTQEKDSRRILSREGYRRFCRQETYVLARSRLSAAALPESDLFAGIPDEEDPGR
jgi:LmbE family N-acetylglucosaminyl deacetylase